MLEGLPAFTLDDRGYVLGADAVEVQGAPGGRLLGAGVPVGVVRPAARARCARRRSYLTPAANPINASRAITNPTPYNAAPTAVTASPRRLERQPVSTVAKNTA
jgi:hypothetical protein